MGKCRERFVYLLEILEHPGLIKVGIADVFDNRLYNLNDRPFYTHKKMRTYRLERRAAESLEARLKSAYSPWKTKHRAKEYFMVGMEEIARIKKDGKHVFRMLEKIEAREPATLGDCVRAGLVKMEATVYLRYETHGGKTGDGYRDFMREMKALNIDIPAAAIKKNPSKGKAPWTGIVTIRPGTSGKVSSMIVNELRKINREKRHGKKSKVKPPKKDGSVATCSCTAFRYLAPLVWPAGRE